MKTKTLPQPPPVADQAITGGGSSSLSGVIAEATAALKASEAAPGKASEPKVYEVLDKAVELLSDPARWTTGWWAISRDGMRTQVLSENACRFCTLGAIGKVMGIDGEWSERTNHYGKVGAFLQRDYLYAGFGDVAGFNDQSSHEQVVNRLKIAAANARREDV